MARRPLSWPITLAIVMILLLVALTVGWVVLAVKQALADTPFSGLYWAMLAVGSTFLGLVLVGTVLYLVLTIKAINLSRRQSNFIDSVTHELKSPIASLKLYLQTLNRRQVTEEQAADFYRFMLADVERLDQLINHMLDAARLEVEEEEAEVEEVDLPSILRDSVQTVVLRYRVPESSVVLEVEPCVVTGRSVDVDLVFRNLIDNAVKYAASEPHVEIHVRVQKDTVITRISDNGRGIPAKHRRKIFGRFVRLGRELERERPGTGLGLYIVRTLVKRMSGKVQVRDGDGGVGTVFEVQLPGARKGAAQAA